MELGREADLEVAHAFGLRVLAQLEGHALEGLLVLEHGHRVAEALEVLGQVAVALAEDLLAEALLGLRGQGDLPAPGQVDEGGEAQGPVEVDVEVGLGQAADEVGGQHVTGLS